MKGFGQVFCVWTGRAVGLWLLLSCVSPLPYGHILFPGPGKCRNRSGKTPSREGIWFLERWLQTEQQKVLVWGVGMKNTGQSSSETVRNKAFQVCSGFWGQNLNVSGGRWRGNPAMPRAHLNLSVLFSDGKGKVGSRTASPELPPAWLSEERLKIRYFSLRPNCFQKRHFWCFLLPWPVPPGTRSCRAEWQKLFAGWDLPKEPRDGSTQFAIVRESSARILEVANPPVLLVQPDSVSTSLEKEVDILKVRTNGCGKVSLGQVCDVGMGR